MDLVHRCGKLRREITGTEVDINHGGFDVSVARKGGDLVNIPISARKVRKAEMAHSMR